jgi:cytochrome c oxidase assembly protein subunit 15
MQIISGYSQRDKRVFNWLMLGCILIILIVVIGGITRLTQSGLSMVKWEPIMGVIPPMSPAEWTTAFEQYQQFPEFKHYNSNFTLSDFKSIFFWEYLHRLLARLIGLVFIFPCIVFWMRGYFSKKLKKQVLLILLFGMFQAVLGWVMVKSGLVDDPHVSHYRLAAHLITALGLLTYIFWIALSVKYEVVPSSSNEQIKLRRILRGFIFVVFVQLIYGAFVAGLKAGFWYNTFPKMGNNWLPAELSYVLEQKGMWAFFESPGIVQFIHRMLAYTIVGILIYLWFRIKKNALTKAQNKLRTGLTIIVLLQFLLGVLTLILVVPVSVGVIHQFGAILLLLSLFTFLYSTSANKAQRV